jgi:hypothetical protein
MNAFVVKETQFNMIKVNILHLSVADVSVGVAGEFSRHCICMAFVLSPFSSHHVFNSCSFAPSVKGLTFSTTREAEQSSSVGMNVKT